MKKLLVLLIILSGCSIQVPGYTIEHAQSLCENHKGIYHIDTARAWPKFHVKCQDGITFKEVE